MTDKKKFKFNDKAFFRRLAIITIIWFFISMVPAISFIAVCSSYIFVMGLALSLFYFKRRLKGLLFLDQDKGIVVVSKRFCSIRRLVIKDISRLYIRYKKKSAGGGHFGYSLSIYIDNKKYVEIVSDAFGYEKILIDGMLKNFSQLGVKKLN